MVKMMIMMMVVVSLIYNCTYAMKLTKTCLFGFSILLSLRVLFPFIVFINVRGNQGLR